MKMMEHVIIINNLYNTTFTFDNLYFNVIFMKIKNNV
jgi:hypothetical protein